VSFEEVWSLSSTWNINYLDGCGKLEDGVLNSG